MICDNNSTDETWSLARDLIPKSYPKVVFVQTPINLGGYGAFSLNFDLFKHAEWVTTFHQDDKYGQDHLSGHAELTSSAAPNIGLIASEQQSYAPNGSRLGYPRAYWFLPPNPEPARVFLANLKRHTLPFSGASFRRQLLEEIRIPWHSTAFPDTELVLRMLPKWSGMVDSNSVVQYLENPLSESHSIENPERNLGAAMALARVFASRNFSELCSLVPAKERETFVSEVLAGLDHRIEEITHHKFTTTLALEIMFQEFGPLPVISQKLESVYYNIGAYTASDLLHTLHTTLSSQESESCLRIPAEKRGHRVKAEGISGRHSTLKRLLARLLGILPIVIRKGLVRKLISLANKLGIQTSWKV